MSQIEPLPDEPRLLSSAARPLLLLLVTVALLRGLLYLAVVPPWQHYDEPTHFEYVRLIAERGRLPQPGDSDLQMRRAIAASMQAAGFWKLINGQPPDLASDVAPNIGFSELEHPPLYYTILAVLQWLLKPGSVEAQLYLARLGSVLLYPVVVVAAYGLAAEVFPRRKGLSLAVAGLVAFLPPLADLMSSVNNDAGAAAVSSLLLWSSVRLMQRGLSPMRAGVTLSLAAACFVTKNTAGSMAVVVLLALGLALLPRPWRRWLWATLALLTAILLPVAFTWTGHAAHWVNDDQSAAPNRQQIASPVGSSVFVLSRDGKDHPSALFQELEITAGQRLRGHAVTFGIWLKAADERGGAVAIRLYDESSWYWHNVQVSPTWQFYSLNATIAPEAPTVSASIGFPREGWAQSVYADGIVLVDRAVLSREPPGFDTPQAETGTWGGQPFDNLLRNGSAERSWPALRPRLSQMRLFETPTSWIVASLLDWSRTAWVYRPDVTNMVMSFWGWFGWGTPALPAGWLYLFGPIAVLALAGVALGLARGRTPWLRQVGTVLGPALIVGWGSAVLRIHPVFVLKDLFWPSARYASVVIAPTALLLCAGLATTLPRRWLRWEAYAGLVGMIALEVVAMCTVIVPYYYA
jgi:hypothetical protein